MSPVAPGTLPRAKPATTLILLAPVLDAKESMTLEPASRRLALLWCGGVHGEEAEEVCRAARKGAHLQRTAQTEPAYDARSRAGAR